ncbi:uncharacterized protein LOC117644902 [Thrips palmi]|uniref:Uncharacterized protein LOC117644902 n=1 Tax=Thrips palmi TaxID=161013 RepID=A0A6P8YTS0_THRPL|nr:uncharacterized protein LOC117644902 [Thrips palmi]
MPAAVKALILLALAALTGLAAAKKKPSAPLGSKLIFQWVEMEHCPETFDMNATYELRYMRNGDVFADTTFHVRKPAQTITKLRQIITSCTEAGAECEHFMTWDSPMEGCAFISAKHAVWSPTFVNIKPPFLCPIATGLYVNNNWTVDKNLLNLLPFPRNHLYKDRVEMWNEKNELFWCFIFHLIFKLYKPRT